MAELSSLSARSRNKTVNLNPLAGRQTFRCAGISPISPGAGDRNGKRDSSDPHRQLNFPTHKLR